MNDLKHKMGHRVDLLLVLAALCTVAHGDTQAVACPDGVGQEIISDNPSLLNTDNIIASSARSSLPAENIVNFDFYPTQSVWCTREVEDPKPTIDITFSQPVVITGLLSGGYTYTQGDLEYVTNFNISGLDSGETLGFVVPQINLFLPVCPPIVAETVHLAVLDYQEYIGDICWALAFFGCPLPERLTASTSAVPVTTTSIVSTSKLSSLPASSSISATPTASPSPSVSTSPAVGESSSGEVRVEKDYMVLAIVLPVAILTISIVAVIVAVGVLLCANRSGQWSPYSLYSRPRTATDVTVKVVDNTELYHPGIVVQTGERTVAPSGPVSSRGQDPSCGDAVYEHITPQTGDIAEDEEGLRHNPMYGTSGEYDDNEVKLLTNECYVSASVEGTADYAYPSVTVPNPPTVRVNPYEDTSF